MSVHEIFRHWDELDVIAGGQAWASADNKANGCKWEACEGKRRIETFFNGDDAIVFDPAFETLDVDDVVLAVSKSGAGGDYVYCLKVSAIYDRHDGRKKAVVKKLGKGACVAHRRWSERNEDQYTAQELRWSKRKELGL